MKDNERKSFCTNCGEKLEKDDDFCTKCGTSLTEGKKENLNKNNFNNGTDFLDGSNKKNRNKKILLIVGIAAVILLSIFAYQNYFAMPEFKNETLAKGLEVAVPIDSNFTSNGDGSFSDMKTNMSVKLLRSENDIVDANVNNPKDIISYDSKIVMVFENYTVATDENKEVGIKISNISNVRGNIVTKIAESAVVSPSLKFKKIGEDEAERIAIKTKDGKYDVNAYAMTVTSYYDPLALSSELSNYNNKTAYKVIISYKKGGAGGVGDKIYIRKGVTQTDTIYVDAYNGKIIK